MTKTRASLMASTALLFAMACAGLAQVQPGIVGAWTGHTFVGDGSRAEFTLVVDKGAEGLTARITSETGDVPDMACRNVAFADHKLTFDLDFPEGMDVILIRISLTLEGDTLKGDWANPQGETNTIDLVRKRTGRA